MSISASKPITRPIVKPIVITSGDPAGIGPDLVLQLGQHLGSSPWVVIADIDVLTARAQQLSFDNIAFSAWQPGDALPAPSATKNTPNTIAVWHCPAGATVRAGYADPATAVGTLEMLRRAAQGCLDGTFSAMVTAPVAKNIICDGADPSFTGHTEFLAEQANAKQVVMMLVGKTLRVALATTHLPLRDVADAITSTSLETTLRILQRDLQNTFAIASPRILVLGLNPHAGESGHLGHEEIDTIIPLLERLRAEGFALTGPVPADTAFNQTLLNQHDAVLAMYHDQGLPVLKFSSFGEAVNITLGLPFIRTSVDHGTAFDLAGTGKAQPGSLIAATQLALTLAAHSVASSVQSSVPPEPQTK
ncbi:MAG: 4-hydroxythreonine-4-phosphate dehydrogenase PdxA [Gammaproteobacteria bacterium]|jgi:4-hydroxythreonine-4-phosphate dehydrogenase|nr:4-hydroxythreonine-4-phosphate dehydrogenase PdxA [Gammaproteobacteria bacterium]MBQ0773194.1 4-hydroxythreonine-4-phosphate dehydrogenase PdxA [Gammaproteobacteria bacterium]